MPRRRRSTTCCAIATRPVVASHTGVRAVCDNARNLSDDQLRADRRDRRHGRDRVLADAPAAATTSSWIARSIAHAVAVVGADHVGLGSDFDGAVPVPFDASGMGLLTGALLGQGLDETQIAAVMGGSAIRLLREALPPGPWTS